MYQPITIDLSFFALDTLCKFFTFAWFNFPSTSYDYMHILNACIINAGKEDTQTELLKSGMHKNDVDYLMSIYDEWKKEQ